jgi:hypothetical protein
LDAAACLHALRDRAAEAEMLPRAQADALEAG